jgi:PhnB protein
MTTEKALVQTYLFFHGRCEEALEFYQKAVGAKVEAKMRFSDSPEKTEDWRLAPGFENKIMHSSFRVGSTVVMASDGCGDSALEFKGFSLALSVPTEAEADRVFAALSDGGKVTMPLMKTFWSPKYGMLADRFGVEWMVMVVADCPE